MEPISRRLQVPLVPYADWLAALERSAGQDGSDVDKLRDNPALRLLAFFRGVNIDESREPLGSVALDTSKAAQVAPALGLLELDAGYVEKWLRTWQGLGYLRGSA